MWDTKQKTNEQTHINTDNRKVVTTGEGRWGEDKVKGVKYMEAERPGFG